MKTKQPKGTMVTIIEIHSKEDGRTYYTCYKGDMRKTFQSRAPSALFVVGSDQLWHKVTGKAPYEYAPEESEGNLPHENKSPADWRENAACKEEEDLRIFFPADSEMTQSERQEAETRAKAYCASCPVKGECLEHALSKPERYGIWGGLNEKEREVLRKNRKQESRVTDLR